MGFNTERLRELLNTRLTKARADKIDNLDTNVGSRLAASAYVSPDNAGIAAIKADTDTIQDAAVSAATTNSVGHRLNDIQVSRVGAPGDAASASGTAHAKLTELLGRLTSGRAANLDAAVSSRAAPGAAMNLDANGKANVRTALREAAINATGYVTGSVADYLIATWNRVSGNLDTTVSSRLAASSYTAPDNTGIAGAKSAAEAARDRHGVAAANGTANSYARDVLGSKGDGTLATSTASSTSYSAMRYIKTLWDVVRTNLDTTVSSRQVSWGATTTHRDRIDTTISSRQAGWGATSTHAARIDTTISSRASSAQVDELEGDTHYIVDADARAAGAVGSIAWLSDAIYDLVAARLDTTVSSRASSAQVDELEGDTHYIVDADARAAGAVGSIAWLADAIYDRLVANLDTTVSSRQASWGATTTHRDRINTTISSRAPRYTDKVYRVTSEFTHTRPAAPNLSAGTEVWNTAQPERWIVGATIRYINSYDYASGVVVIEKGAGGTQYHFPFAQAKTDGYEAETAPVYVSLPEPIRIPAGQNVNWFLHTRYSSSTGTNDKIAVQFHYLE